VVAVQRRRVFVGIGRIGEIGTDGARLRRGSVNLRQFELRPGERLIAGELLGTRLRGLRVVDVGITPAPEPFAWEIATVALAGRRVPGLRRSPKVIDWSEAGELFASDSPVDRQAAELGGLHPAEMAATIRRLPLCFGRQTAANAPTTLCACVVARSSALSAASGPNAVPSIRMTSTSVDW